MSTYLRVRRAATRMISASRLDLIADPVFGGVGAILAMHRVRSEEATLGEWSRTVTITPAHLSATILRLRERGYRFVTMSELVSCLRDDRTHERFACLTFDDGYADNWQNAFPVCHALGAPMTIFVTTGFMNRTCVMWWLGLERVLGLTERLQFMLAGTPFDLPARGAAEKRAAHRQASAAFTRAHPDAVAAACEELAAAYSVDFGELTDAAMLNVGDLRAMVASGIVEFGGHTVRHPSLATLSDEEAWHEIVQGCEELGRLTGVPVRHFAFPFGDRAAAGAREFRLCRAAGLESAVTTRMGTLFPAHGEQRFALPRLTLHGALQDLQTVDALVSGVLPALRNRLRRW